MRHITEWQRRYFPELLLFENKKQRKRAMKVAMKGIVFNPIYMLLMILSIPVIISFKFFLIRYTPLPGTAIAAICGGLIGFLGGRGAIIASKQAITESLRRQLTDLGVHLCMNCGYDLRGSAGRRCPECGVEFEISGPPPRTE